MGFHTNMGRATLCALLLCVLINTKSSHSQTNFAAYPSQHQLTKTSSFAINNDQQPQYTSSESQQNYNHSPRSTSTNQQQQKCQMIKKPMSVYGGYGAAKQMMMTCYVCGDGYGHYSEDCKYIPNNNNNNGESYSQTTQHYSHTPQKNYQNSHNYNNNNHQKPQQTQKTNSYNENRPGISCKTVLKGHMSCKICGDPQTDAIFSEQCDFESANPGQNGAQSYDFSHVNEKTYRDPFDFGALNSYIPDFDGFHGGNEQYKGGDAHGGVGARNDGGSYVAGSSTGHKQIAASPNHNKNNCKTMYKEMSSNFSPYSTGKPKMKCEVCVRSDGYGGVTEECNYSHGNGDSQAFSAPGAQDFSSFYGNDRFYSPFNDNDYFGDYLY